MRKTQHDIAAVWECIATKIRGRGRVLNEKETAVRVVDGKRSGYVEVMLDQGVINAMSQMINNESKKLVIRSEGRHHLLRYLAFCGGVEFRPHRIMIRDVELFYALGYIFQQTLRRIKRSRVEEEKGSILEEASKIVDSLIGKKRITSVFYSGGLFHARVSGIEKSAIGINKNEVISSLKKLL